MAAGGSGSCGGRRRSITGASGCRSGWRRRSTPSSRCAPQISTGPWYRPGGSQCVRRPPRLLLREAAGLLLPQGGRRLGRGSPRLPQPPPARRPLTGVLWQPRLCPALVPPVSRKAAAERSPRFLWLKVHLNTERAAASGNARHISFIFSSWGHWHDDADPDVRHHRFLLYAGCWFQCKGRLLDLGRQLGIPSKLRLLLSTLMPWASCNKRLDVSALGKSVGLTPVISGINLTKYHKESY